MKKLAERCLKHYRILQRSQQQVQWFISNLGYAVHKDPVFIFGNQKTGSTAIAALLAQATQNTAILDMFYRIPWTVETRLLQKSLPFGTFVQRHRRLFSAKVIKEPDLVFFLDDLTACFPASKMVFLLRDPRDNIRSILNRLNLPGSQEQLTEPQFANLPSQLWRIVMEGTLFGTQGNSYIETMALRWRKMVELYESRSDRILLLRYETFLEDKVGCIGRLADQLDLRATTDISSAVDTQYQPRGDRSTRPLEFFGRSNLAVIERVCGEKMRQYGYPLLLDAP